MTVKVVLAEAPLLSVAVMLCAPGVVCVSTLIMAVNIPLQLTITFVGTVGMTVPSQEIVTVEHGLKPKPTTVVAANPLSGTARMTSGIKTLSITWIMPFVHSMSTAVIFALFTQIQPTVIVRFPPCSVWIELKAAMSVEL